jgi:hypothetical protein
MESIKLSKIIFLYRNFYLILEYINKTTKNSMKQFLNIATEVQLDRLEDIGKCQRN